jgi:hypothetical protein
MRNSFLSFMESSSKRHKTTKNHFHQLHFQLKCHQVHKDDQNKFNKHLT